MDKDELITKQHDDIVSIECALYDGQVVTSIDDSPSEFDMPYLPCDESRLTLPLEYKTPWVSAKIEDAVLVMHPDDFVHLKLLWPTYVEEAGNDSA